MIGVNDTEYEFYGFIIFYLFYDAISIWTV
jgi:hypothetical protein